jgi:hypothetical protein
MKPNTTHLALLCAVALLIVTNPELRAFLLLSQAIGADVVLLLVTLQIRAMYGSLHTRLAMSRTTQFLWLMVLRLPTSCLPRVEHGYMFRAVWLQLSHRLSVLHVV